MRAGERGFHALAVIPAVDGRLAARIGHAGHMGVGASAEALRNAGQHARPARRRRSDYNRGLGRFANGFRRCCIDGVARLAEILAGHAEIFCGGTSRDGIRRRLDAFADKAHDEAGAGKRFVQGAGRVQRFAGRFGERAVGLGMGE